MCWPDVCAFPEVWSVLALLISLAAASKVGIKMNATRLKAAPYSGAPFLKDQPLAAGWT